MLFANKVALVTGGGSGIGRATALELAKEGAAVVVGNRNIELGESTADAIRHSGGKAVFQRTDVTKPEEVEALVKRAVKEFGRLDLALNNSGVDGPIVPVQDHDNEKAKMILDVNVMGVFYGMKFEIEQMLRQEAGGAIVNTGSIAGLKGLANMSMYVASKHAVSGLTKSAALENAQKRIRINAVAPGPIETPMLFNVSGGDPHSLGKLVPMGRIAQPIEVARAVVWLLSDHASYITGHILPVDGGWCGQ